MNEKIGIGIITHQPRESFKKAFDFWHHMVSDVVVVNDGEEFDYNFSSNFRRQYISIIPETTLSYYKNEQNLGVAKTKNKALKHLYDADCEHIFLMEDDIYIKDNKVFDAYIQASKDTGIQHFNFSQHGMMNKKWPGGTPNPKHIIDYGNSRVAFYTHCVGAFSYYSRKSLEEVGYMDEKYYNACEHVDHTYKIIKEGLHPPFWYFADIDESWKYLGDEEWSLEQSKISSKSDHQEIMKNADKVFFKKHNHLPVQTPLQPENVFFESLKQIKKKYGK